MPDLNEIQIRLALEFLTSLSHDKEIVLIVVEDEHNVRMIGNLEPGKLEQLLEAALKRVEVQRHLERRN